MDAVVSDVAAMLRELDDLRGRESALSGSLAAVKSYNEELLAAQAKQRKARDEMEQKVRVRVLSRARPLTHPDPPHYPHAPSAAQGDGAGYSAPDP
jgi:hypothetical protein